MHPAAAGMRVARGLLLAAVVAAAPACGRAGGPPPLRIALVSEPHSLSPLLALNDYEQFVDRLVFDVLVSADEHGNLVPRLAAEVPTLQNGGISRNGRTLTYRLRRNVRWHDGTLFTSRDVAFSWRALMNPANNVVNRYGYDLVERVETPDAYTVVFRLRRPYGPAVATLFSDTVPNPIFPEHLLGKLPDLNRVPFNAQPIGTGPFKVVRWMRGQSVELEANDAYYGGKPKLRRISVRFVGDEGSILNQLRAHELDAYVVTSLNAYGLGKSIPGVRGVASDVHGATVILINNTVGPLRDVRVRRAVAAATDKRQIVDRFTFGAALPATADLPPFMWAFDARVRAQGYDPALARRLVREAGYDERRPLRLSYAYSVNSVTARVIGVQMQSYLRAAGIDVDLKGYTSNTMFAPYAEGGILQAGKFDLGFYTMTLGLDPDGSTHFTCAALPPRGENYARYCSGAMDVAQAAGAAAIDRAARRRAYAKSQELLARDVPFVFVYWPKNTDLVSDRLRGFAPNPVTSSWNAEGWSLEGR